MLHDKSVYLWCDKCYIIKVYAYGFAHVTYYIWLHKSFKSIHAGNVNESAKLLIKDPSAGDKLKYKAAVQTVKKQAVNIRVVKKCRHQDNSLRKHFCT